ncbi:hypothetical protein ASE51_27110 [Bacillus sp. Root147]|nr:hypothetical protein ASE51_27110 [Bacillus sp. Root147]
MQFIQDNWDYLITNDYFGNDELLLLMKISGKVGFLSNCIVHDIHAKSQIPMTQSDIASYLGINKGNLSRIIKSLIDKGVIVRAVGFKEGINARAYSLYLNPHIIYSGIEVIHMLKKKQVYQEVKSVQDQNEFIHKLFGSAS